MTAFVTEVLPSKVNPSGFFVARTLLKSDCKTRIGPNVAISPIFDTIELADKWQKTMGSWTPQERDESDESWTQACQRFYQNNQ